MERATFLFTIPEVYTYKGKEQHALSLPNATILNLVYYVRKKYIIIYMIQIS